MTLITDSSTSLSLPLSEIDTNIFKINSDAGNSDVPERSRGGLPFSEKVCIYRKKHGTDGQLLEGMGVWVKEGQGISQRTYMDMDNSVLMARGNGGLERGGKSGGMGTTIKIK